MLLAAARTDSSFADLEAARDEADDKLLLATTEADERDLEADDAETDITESKDETDLLAACEAETADLEAETALTEATDEAELASDDAEDEAALAASVSKLASLRRGRRDLRVADFEATEADELSAGTLLLEAAEAYEEATDERLDEIDEAAD